MLFGSGLIDRRGLGTELYVDGLAVDLVGPFEVRTMTLGGMAMAGATRLAALHHSLQHRSLAEALQLFDAPFEFMEALPVAFQDRAVLLAPNSSLGRGALHVSSGNNTGRV